MSDTVVLGAAVGYSEAQIAPFLRSLRASGYSGDVVLLLDPRKAPGLAGTALADGVTLVDARQWLPVRYGLLRGRRRWVWHLVWRPLSAPLWLAVRLLARMGALLAPGDALLLGTDLVKDPAVLRAAYDDAQGVTAEFNRNLLRVVNRKFRATFDPQAFDHLARWDGRRRRIEMHLVARRPQVVSVAACGLTLRLRRGERIRTEVSCKYTRLSVARLLSRAGLSLERWMPDAAGSFALSLARLP